MKKNKNLKVSIIMGSQSDYKIMSLAVKVLKNMGIKFETKKPLGEPSENAMKDLARQGTARVVVYRK